MARARAELSLQPLGNNVSYISLAPTLSEHIASDNASVRLGVLRLMVVLCEHEAKQTGNDPSFQTTFASTSSVRGSSDSKPAKKRKASITPSASDSVAIEVVSYPNDFPVAPETEAPDRSSGPSVTVTILQILRLAGKAASLNCVISKFRTFSFYSFSMQLTSRKLP